MRHAAEKLGDGRFEAHAVPAGVRFAPGLGDGVRNVGGGQLHGIVYAPAERQRACAGAGEQVARAVEHGGNIWCAALRHRARGIHARHADAARESYYHYLTKAKWGDLKNYHLTLNSSPVGKQACAEIILQYASRKNG